MTTIPKEITIPLADFQRAALTSLMAGIANSDVGEALQLVLAKGLRALLVGQDLPEVKRQLAQGGERDLPEDDHIFRSPRASANYLGFPIDSEREAQLDELLKEHPHLSEEEVCRIVFDFGLRAVQTSPFARRLLANTKPKSPSDDRGQR
jgi:hypothetical protein